MSKREYFIAEMDKSASGIEYPGYKSWKLQIQDFDKAKVAMLTNGTDKIYKRALSTEDEKEFAQAVFGDLVKKGLTYTNKKYGFTVNFKAITEDGTVDKDPGQLKPNNDRVSADGITDKDKYAPQGAANGAISDNVTTDKDYPPDSYSSHASPSLKASTEKKADVVAPAAEPTAEVIRSARPNPAGLLGDPSRDEAAGCPGSD